MPRKLGTDQAGMLAALQRRGCWYDACVWRWRNLSTTVDLLESLVSRGLVTKTMVPLAGKEFRTEYRPAKAEANRAA